MTENEAIERLILSCDSCGSDNCRLCDEALEMVSKAFEELKQYREIGTVEDMAFYKKCYDEESYEYCGEYGTDNCGCKDRMEHLEKKIAEFEAIGTIDEFKEFRSGDFTENLLNMGYTKGYNKAIDEFAKRLKTDYVNFELYYIFQDNEFADDTTSLKYYQKMIDEISEELKEVRGSE